MMQSDAEFLRQHARGQAPDVAARLMEIADELEAAEATAQPLPFPEAQAFDDGGPE